MEMSDGLRDYAVSPDGEQVALVLRGELFLMQNETEAPRTTRRHASLAGHVMGATDGGTTAGAYSRVARRAEGEGRRTTVGIWPSRSRPDPPEPRHGGCAERRGTGRMASP